MLLILILLLTFTDFELSEQNIETEAIHFFKIEFYDTYWNIFVTFYILYLYMNN